MTEEELVELAAIEVSLAAYLIIVFGETDNTYAPMGSTILQRLQFINQTLDDMI